MLSRYRHTGMQHCCAKLWEATARLSKPTPVGHVAVQQHLRGTVRSKAASVNGRCLEAAANHFWPDRPQPWSGNAGLSGLSVCWPPPRRFFCLTLSRWCMISRRGPAGILACRSALHSRNNPILDSWSLRCTWSGASVAVHRAGQKWTALSRAQTHEGLVHKRISEGQGTQTCRSTA